MRAFITVKYHEDNSNRKHIEAISLMLEKQGFDTFCIARDVERWGEMSFSASELMERTFHEIDVSDMVIVDLTEKGVGVGIEAGYAFANNMPIITIAKINSPISETLRGISKKVFHFDIYEDLKPLLAEMSAYIEQQDKPNGGINDERIG